MADSPRTSPARSSNSTLMLVVDELSSAGAAGCASVSVMSRTVFPTTMRSPTWPANLAHLAVIENHGPGALADAHLHLAVRISD